MQYLSKLVVLALFAVNWNGAGLAATPDELSLRARVVRFYELQIAGRHAEAAQLVAPESRPIFLRGSQVPYRSCKINRVLITALDIAQVEVTVEIVFPPPVLRILSRTFSTPWKKIGGKWYFVVDPAVLDIIGGKPDNTAPEAKPVLTFKPLITFGLDSEIQKSLRIENNSSGIVQFQVVGLDQDWLEIKNRRGEIPAGEYFPIVVVLKKVPTESRKLVMRIEGTEPNRKITLLEVPIQLQVPTTQNQKEIERAIRKYRQEQ